MNAFPTFDVICNPTNSTPIEITTVPVVVFKGVKAVRKTSLSICTDTESVVDSNKFVLALTLASAVVCSSPKETVNKLVDTSTLAPASILTVSVVYLMKLQ
jgi:hypothetical protein